MKYLIIALALYAICFSATHASTSEMSSFFGGVYFPYQPQQPQYVDFCDLTCRSRFTINGEKKDFFFDKSNGCISKGFTGPRADVFNQCCDEHNQCLNSKCCTNNCQELKQDCDRQYEACTKQVCSRFIHDNTKFLECFGDGITIRNANAAINCNAQHTRNRKLCYCHI
jgi:hypothetical protein